MAENDPPEKRPILRLPQSFAGQADLRRLAHIALADLESQLAQAEDLEIVEVDVDFSLKWRTAGARKPTVAKVAQTYLGGQN